MPVQKNKPLIIILLFLNLSLFAQTQRCYNWFFGTNSGITFTNTSPQNITSSITTSLGSAAVSAANGQLLFYTDGATVYNQSHTVMANGSGLLGLGDQPVIILPKPGSTSLYYIFTSSNSTVNPGLYYSIVDITLAAGQGSVVSKNVMLHNTCEVGKITAGKHCNGIDYWVVSSHTLGIAAYSLSSSGVSSSPVISSPLFSFYKNCYIKLSPNSRKIASVNYTESNGGGISLRGELADFNNATGQVSSNPLVFINTGSSHLYNNYETPYGVEFSPDGQYLYYNFSTLFQLDLCSPTFSNLIGGYIPSQESNTLNYTYRRAFQLAPDYKIYMANPGTNSLGVIQSPTSFSTSCGFQPTGYSLGTNTVQNGLPNFPGFFFEQKPRPYFTYTPGFNSCMSLSFSPSQVCPSTGYTITGYQWHFGDNASGSFNTTTAANPGHTFTSPGSYTVTLIRYFNTCSFSSDTIKQSVLVTSPLVSVNSNSVCVVNQATANVIGGGGTYTYTWTPGNYTTAIITVSVPTNYSLTVYDITSKCYTIKTGTLNVIQLQTTQTLTPPNCHGFSNGTILVNPTGGSGNYSYSWTPNNTNTPVIGSLPAGTYIVSIYDLTNNCQISRSYTLTAPASLQAQLLLSSDSICSGQTVTVNLIQSGGTAPFQYNIQNNSTSGLLMLTPTITGIQTITANVVDANGCSSGINTKTILSTPFPTLAVSNITICNGATATISANGAQNYNWHPGNFITPSFTTTILTPTQFTVIGFNYQCSSTATVQADTASASVFINGGIYCEKDQINFSSPAGLSYYWSGPTNYSSVIQNPVITNALPLNSGIYQLIYTAYNSCTAASQASITVNPQPQLSITGPTLICTLQSSSIVASGASQYQWNTGVTNPTLNLLLTGTTTFSLKGISSLGCNADTTITVLVKTCESVLENNFTHLNLYPNPAYGAITIESEVSGNFFIYNALGQELYQGIFNIGLNSFPFEYPPGMYTFYLKSDKIKQSFKVIKQ